jgi:F0F1-type ATP synthase membrane subunit c/vacuolar-type H+-ATPase subunit K
LLAIMIASLVISVIKTTAGDIENAKKWFVRGMIGAVISSVLTMVVLVLYL